MSQPHSLQVRDSGDAVRFSIPYRNSALLNRRPIPSAVITVATPSRDTELTPFPLATPRSIQRPRWHRAPTTTEGFIPCPRGPDSLGPALTPTSPVHRLWAYSIVLKYSTLWRKCQMHSPPRHRVLRHDPRPRLSRQRPFDVLRRGDEGLLAPFLQELDDGFDLGSHAPWRKVSLG